MSEFRFDPIKCTWVILAARRGERPSQYQSDTQPTPEPRTCPFCPGNESMTPPEVYALRPPGTSPDTAGWRVRVIPNKFPALSPDLQVGQFDREVHSFIPGFGIHEVIIETSVKNRQMADMEPEEIAEVLFVYRERMSIHRGDSRLKTVIVFKNHGKEAGASLVHSHTQLMALPVVPDHIAARAGSFADHGDGCLMCDIMAKEIEDGTRVILEDERFLVMAPFAASSPFQVNIVPKPHSHDFSLSDDDVLDKLATVLGDTLRRLRSVLGEHPWNMVLHSAPSKLDDGSDVTAYHWSIEITPRLTQTAGFEMGSGIFINTVAPEESAEILRAQGAGRSRSLKRGNGETEIRG